MSLERGIVTIDLVKHELGFVVTRLEHFELQRSRLIFKNPRSMSHQQWHIVVESAWSNLDSGYNDQLRHVCSPLCSLVACCAF